MLSGYRNDGYFEPAHPASEYPVVCFPHSAVSMTDLSTIEQKAKQGVATAFRTKMEKSHGLKAHPELRPQYEHVLKQRIADANAGIEAVITLLREAQ